jgi:hypothetical protein
MAHYDVVDLLSNVVVVCMLCLSGGEWKVDEANGHQCVAHTILDLIAPALLLYVFQAIMSNVWAS